MTPINRQNYMAEVENLLGLITDEETRTKLLAQMEQMFDAAEDEGKLIEQIGSPTKVAVALIRYADKKRAGESAKAESVPEPEAPVTEMLSEVEANAAAPEESNMPELAFAEAAEEPEVVEAPAFIEAPAVELPEEDAAVPERLEEVLLPTTGFVAEDTAPVEEPVVDVAEEAADAFVEVAQEAETVPPVMDEAFVKAVAAEAEEAFGEVPAQAEVPAQEAEAETELVQELFGNPEEEAPAAEDAQEPEKEYVKVGWKAFLYFLIPGLVPGLPVFLVLFALSLVFLAVGVAAVGFAVGVFMSAFVGFNVVADMLLLIGAGASIFAVAMVLLWFGIWFLTQVCFGWVRLIHRGGVRFSRKEVRAA